MGKVLSFALFVVLVASQAQADFVNTAHTFGTTYTLALNADGNQAAIPVSYSSSLATGVNLIASGFTDTTKTTTKTFTYYVIADSTATPGNEDTTSLLGQGSDPGTATSYNVDFTKSSDFDCYLYMKTDTGTVYVTYSLSEVATTWWIILLVVLFCCCPCIFFLACFVIMVLVVCIVIALVLVFCVVFFPCICCLICKGNDKKARPAARPQFQQPMYPQPMAVPAAMPQYAQPVYGQPQYAAPQPAININIGGQPNPYAR